MAGVSLSLAICRSPVRNGGTQANGKRHSFHPPSDPVFTQVFLLSSSGKGLPSPTISASLFLIYLIINGTDSCHFKYLVLEERVPPNHPVFPYPGILGLPVFISTFY